MRAARGILIAAGVAGMGYAVLGAFTDPDIEVGVLIFLAAVLVLHDGLLLPAVIGVGALVGRYVPSALRSPVRVASMISLMVAVVALPLVLGFGRAADNPSILPRPYGQGLLITLAVVWVAVGAVTATRAWNTRRHRPQP